jgi:molybdopterin synthase sulfur carrier subunit
MKVTIKYFGLLTDITQKSEEILFLEDTISLKDCLDILYSNYTNLSEFTFKIAVNQQIIDSDVSINENDIVALMPPFAGG